MEHAAIAADLPKPAAYAELLRHVQALVEGVGDEIAVLATVVCELHHTFAHFHWTGFYRVTARHLLTVGPYQGSHGCLVIPFDKGVCGACARAMATVVVPDVEQFPGHIACSSTTRSEIVVPLIDPDGTLRAVLDVDSNDPDAFDSNDQAGLEMLLSFVAQHLAMTAAPVARP
jgi:GAF domain-containing protein